MATPPQWSAWLLGKLARASPANECVEGPAPTSARTDHASVTSALISGRLSQHSIHRQGWSYLYSKRTNGQDVSSRGVLSPRLVGNDDRRVARWQSQSIETS